ncbi:hypothetical protein [Kosmotoga pacifica]|uniref:Uncharacterized protein n=1 Tax=Kosmotoga pacifica TaxID=1330330 RepID=A0A0G2Z917_9BACT|nr:hypothetical protein [Kosmotoga pacifica]AKI98095.1 hypothetical protein IX53_09930 [Kosmotoga pacifica]
MASKKRSKGTLSLAEAKRLNNRFRRFSLTAWIMALSSIGILLFLKQGEVLFLTQNRTLSVMTISAFVIYYLSLLFFVLAISYCFIQGKNVWIIFNALLMILQSTALFFIAVEIPYIDRYGKLTAITPQPVRYSALVVIILGIIVGTIGKFNSKK